MLYGLKFGVQGLIALLCIVSLPSFAAEPITCTEAIEKARELNANELWEGAVSCSYLDLIGETNFLLVAGQIRAMTDMSLLQPVSDEEGVKVSDLYRKMYYEFGGSGFEEVFQDRDKYEALTGQIEQWTVEFDSNYNPSWQYKKSIDPTYYEKMILCQKEIRMSKLDWYANLVQNKEYQTLQQQLSEFEVANPDYFRMESNAFKGHSKLRQKMHLISAKAGLPNTKPAECDFIKPFEPDPKASFKQIYKGFNGPNTTDSMIFQSEAEVKESWIAKAINQNELDNLLKDIDFKKKVLVSLSFGKRKAITGTVYISDVDFNTVYKTSTVNGLLGVNQQGCQKYNSEEYYPFALAVADIPPFEITESGGYSVQNFADECE